MTSHAGTRCSWAMSSLRYHLAKLTHVMAFVAGKAVHRLVERLGDTGQRRSRGHRELQLSVRIADQASGVLESRHIDVAEHAVDALAIKDHMLGQGIGDRSRELRSCGAPCQD